jgi:Prenyltransferase and squalene oxidase repeat
MKHKYAAIVIVLVILIVGTTTTGYLLSRGNPRGSAAERRAEKTTVSALNPDLTKLAATQLGSKPQARLLPGKMVMPKVVQSGLAYLAKSQSEDGGSHAYQEERNPHAVKTDPGTTAFVAMAFVRSGNTLDDGPYHQSVSKALYYLLKAVESSPNGSANITTLTGTQPQVKLGGNVDVSFTSQFLTRVIPFTESDPSLNKRTKAALEKCIRKIEKSQSADGSWSEQEGWAPVLQSVMANNALEYADAEKSVAVSRGVKERAKSYQNSNVDGTGSVNLDKSAGVSLYAYSSTNRASAKDVSEAKEVINQAKKMKMVEEDGAVTEENLVKGGISPEKARQLMTSTKTYTTTAGKLNDDDVMSGFGNNGGEEFLSYMMASESKVIANDADLVVWATKMIHRLETIQNTDGSWSGHHCITSPVFCTAAVVLTLSVQNDKEYLSLAGSNK